MNAITMNKTVAQKLRQSSLLITGANANSKTNFINNPIVSAQKSMRSVGSAAKSDNGEESSPNEPSA